MGDIGDQIRFHLFILHAGTYRLADTFSDIIYSIRHLAVISVKRLHIQFVIHFSVTDLADSLHNVNLFRLLLEFEHSHNAIQNNGRKCRKKPPYSLAAKQIRR